MQKLHITRTNGLIAGAVVVVVAIVGYVFATSRASSPFAAFEAEQGTVSSSTLVSTGSDSAASNGQYVQFNQQQSSGGGGGSPSGQAMPVGDLPHWKQVFTDDFTQNVALGQFPKAVSSKWGVGANGSTEYADGGGDTNTRDPDPARQPGGQYWPSKVVSFHDGQMDMYLHTENGIHMAAAPFPIIPGTGTTQSMKYGRYVERWKISNPMPGYKNAWLTWSPNNKLSDGEIDFPESNFGGKQDTTRNPYIDGTYHVVAGDYVPSMEADSNVTPDDWHTTAIEWTPTSINFYIDGNLLRSYTSNLPPNPVYFVLQTETATEGALPAATTSGHVLVDWVSIYSYQP